MGSANGAGALLLGPESQTFIHLSVKSGSLCSPPVRLETNPCSSQDPGLVQMSPGQPGYSQKAYEMDKRGGLSCLHGQACKLWTLVFFTAANASGTPAQELLMQN